MKTFRYAFLAVMVLAPALVAAQPTRDILVNIGGSDFVGLGAAWDDNVPFIFPTEIGPLPLVIVESGTTGEFPDAPPDEGCNPYTAEGAAAVEGNIAFVQRGVCSFVLKTQNASAAGAVAVLIYNDEREPDDSEVLVSMGGDPCGPAEGCEIPAAFVSRASGLAILTEVKFGEEGTIIPQEPPPVPANVPLDNGTIVTSLFANGFVGSDPGFEFGEGFLFGEDNGLFVGSFLIGVGGDVNSNPYDGASEFEGDEDALRGLNPDEIPAPFDLGVTSQFTSPLGFDVTLSAYAAEGGGNEDFVIYEANVENSTGSAINDVYLGMFADFDTGATTSNDDSGAIDEATNTAYVFDAVEGGAYFGLSAIGSLSGASTDASTADDAQLTEALTSIVEPGAEAAERAAVVGVGPFDIAPGATQTVRFAIIAGEDEADLLANAAQAQIAGNVAVEETTPEGTFVLESAYPNPVASRATIGFELPTAQDVRVAVYDVLGREVAVLTEGVRQAGAQTVEFDVSSLPSGVYIYRLSAGSTQLTQTMTVVR